jgi:hypothetical protein
MAATLFFHFFQRRVALMKFAYFLKACCHASFQVCELNVISVASILVVCMLCMLFLGVFAKLRKAIISFVMSIYPSVRVNQLNSHWMDFYEI